MSNQKTTQQLVDEYLAKGGQIRNYSPKKQKPAASEFEPLYREYTSR